MIIMINILIEKIDNITKNMSTAEVTNLYIILLVSLMLNLIAILIIGIG